MKSRLRKRLLVLLWVALVATGAALAVQSVPAWRFGLKGVVRGEPFYQGRTLAYWADALHGSDDGQRLEARLILVEIGAPAVGPLIEALGDNDSSVREDAAAALAGMAPRVPLTEAVDSLVRALDDEDVLVRSNAAAALGYAGRSRPGEVAAALCRLAQADPSPAVRRDATIALERLAGRPQRPD